jgi:hypothetical protein
MTIADISNRIYFLTKTNSSSFASADMLISMNMAYSRVASLILQADGRWQWDDDTQTDLPIATTTITTSQQDYSIAVTHIRLLRAEIKPSGATTFTRLEPVDQADEDYALNATATGTPVYYDKIGNSLFLYPIPNYTQTASLKLYFQRAPADFSAVTGSTSPGFNSLYHDLIPLWVAYDYCVANGLPMAPGYMAEIQRKETQIVADYSKRDKDDRQMITSKQINFR